MTVTAKVLINSKYGSVSDSTEYTAPANTRTIIDKFTATNTDAGSQTITVRIVPSGAIAGASHNIISSKTIATGVTADLSELQNQILAAGDFINVQTSVSSKIVIRASGREVT